MEHRVRAAQAKWGQMRSALLLAPGRATGLSGEDAAVAPLRGLVPHQFMAVLLRVAVGAARPSNLS